ncbi:MAG: hypothetical protein A2Y34_15735 [Spirochaetes bacterium GWC1_27_15]|nr:MAG: hypothetical protein A2Z98_16945 [Spirochaetes bacterium GWB1_27_13]OHD21954.1 MAG: hypothetical protein A2Y34_15735 [Spirochaetes bacterium GWC1_27_15]
MFLKKNIFVFLLIVFFVSYIKSAPIELTILFTNDTNGHPLSFSYNGDEGQGGIPARATLIKKLAGDKKKNNVLILDSGGFLIGRPESNLFDGVPDIAGMNACGYDAVGFGMSEIYDSKKKFEMINKQADFYMLSSNIKVLNFSKNEQDIADTEMIKVFGGISGVKVGIFSVISEDVRPFLSEQAGKEFVITDPIKEAKDRVENLKTKQKVDIVIGLTYLGYFPDDSRIGSRTLASSVPGIDIIIDGKTGLKLEEPSIVNNTRIFQAFKWGLFVGEIKLKIDKKKIIDVQYKLHPVNYKEKGVLIGDKLEEDKQVLTAIKGKMKNFDNLLAKKIVTIKDGNFPIKNIRKDENEFGNLICDALLNFTKTNVAFQNSGGIIDTTIDISKITRKSFDDAIKYDNSVIVVNMTGAEIKQALEFSTKRMGYGSFLQVAGIRFTYSKTNGSISNIKIQDKELIEDNVYKVTINSWIADGGDGYTVFKNIPFKNDLNILVREVVYDYLEKSGNYKPYIDGRINIIE